MSLTTIGDLLTEDEVYEKYGKLLRKGELLAARKAGALGHYQAGRGIFYTEGQLVAYFEMMRKDPCPNRPIRDPSQSGVGEASSVSKGEPISLKINGSAKSRGGRHGSDIGMGQEERRAIEESIAARWEPKI